jgi:cell division protein FtsB
MELDINDVITPLLEQIAALSRENAVLKATVVALQKQNQDVVTGEDNGG